MIKRNYMAVARFLAVSAASFAALEAAEWALARYLGVDLENLGVGWLALVVAYGFKTHIICCVLPMIWAAYECRHRNCRHDQCKNDGGDGPGN